MWIDVTNAAGTPYGDGPITTATHWTNGAAIDKAGRFAFTMPATDPRAALLQNLRYAYCYEMVGGVATLLGAGIIDKRALAAGDPTMLTVSGPDLLAELAARTIPTLTVCEQALTYLTENEDTGHWTGSVRWISNRYGVTFDEDLPGAHDGVTDAGGELITLWSEGDPNIEYVYVGCDARFDRIYITVGDYLETNRRESVLVAQYYNGSAWVDLADVWDGTAAQNMSSQWCTFAQTGAITFTRPADWARVQPTAQAGSWFWVRLTVAPGQETDEIRLREVAVWADVPTTDGVNQIMAYAPDTWTKTGYPQTATAKYLELSGESVLAALIALSEQGGQVDGAPVREHFRLGPGRAITWFSAFADSGLRAVQGSVAAADTCLIQRLTQTVDTSETVTRLYPCSNDGITLALTTRTPPAGYSLNAAEGWLQHDAGATAYGRIEAAPRYTDIQSQQADSWYEHPSMVANAVFDRALEYLRTHGEAQTFYSLEVVGAPASLGVGQTIRVVYHEYRDGYHMVDIDADLYIVGTQNRIGSDGIRTLSLDVATVDRAAQTDAGVIVGAIRDVRRVGTGAGGTTNVTVTGGGGGGASFPGTVSPETINTDTGSEHFHRVDLSTHIANAAAHHAPVTAGNGVAVAGQQVSVALAPTSGLEVSSGLRLADSIAGAGLSITNKVLAVGVQGLGLSVGADAVALTSSANPGAAASILASDAAGALALVKVRTPLIDTASGNLTLQPAGDLVLDPVGNDVLPGAGYDLNLGSLAKKYLTLHAAELWVETLVAHETMATIGGRILVGPTTELTADVTAGSATFALKHNEADAGDVLRLEAGGAVEFVRVQTLTIVAGNQGAKIFAVAGDLTAYFTAGVLFTVRGSTGNNGTYTTVGSWYNAGSGNTEITVSEAIPSGTWNGYIAYRGSGPYLYLMDRNLDGSGANAWYAGDALFNTGVTGEGFIDLYSVHGVKASTQYGPTIAGNVRTGTAYNAWAEHWAIGNLNGLYGYGATAYGAAFGKYADGASFITVDATNGIRMLSRSGGADTVRAQWAVDGTLTIGANGEITLTPAGNVTLGVVATNQGNAYWNATNKRLEFRGGAAGTVVQAYVDTSGAFVAGAGGVVLDGNGLRIIAAKSELVTSSLSFYTQSYQLAAIFAQHLTEGGAVSTHNLVVQAKAVAGSNASASFGAASPTTRPAYADLAATSGVTVARVRAYSDDDGDQYVSVSPRLVIGGQTSAAQGGKVLSLADDASASANGVGTVGRGLYVIYSSEDAATCIAVRNGNDTIILSDGMNVFRTTDTDGYSCLLSAAGTAFTIKNRRGKARSYWIHHLGFPTA